MKYSDEFIDEAFLRFRLNSFGFERFDNFLDFLWNNFKNSKTFILYIV